ncbi:MAG: hypothetical protein Ct9H90mP13_00980 [Pseudomonadota bacterium]|nr:MAG: hypothetical protein Ct9H90mP13_00980 [Pseudomonadota bacterium]
MHEKQWRITLNDDVTNALKQVGHILKIGWINDALEIRQESFVPEALVVREKYHVNQ